MIRDPSDGSVKPQKSAPPAGASQQAERLPKREPAVGGADTPCSANNWGLTSLDRPERKPKPAPTKEELAEYYATHTLGGKMKETDSSGVRQMNKGSS
jgi:hypothetical protein